MWYYKRYPILFMCQTDQQDSHQYQGRLQAVYSWRPLQSRHRESWEVKRENEFDTFLLTMLEKIFHKVNVEFEWMFYFSNLVDSATAGDTLEDNQPLSAKCTSWSGGLEKAIYISGISLSGTGCHLGLLWSGSLAGADCPDRLVGNHHLAPVGHILGNCCQLAEADLDA